MLQALSCSSSASSSARSSSARPGSRFPAPSSGWDYYFAGLLLRGRSGPALDGVADTILRNLSLLFVPAAVGVVQQSGLIAANWLAISTAVIASTALTLVVTVLTFRAVARLGRP